MGVVKLKQQCPSCLDSGKDNLAVYDDGSTYCFACEYTSQPKKFPDSAKNLGSNVSYGLPARGISPEVCEFANYQVVPFTGSIGYGNSKRDLVNESVHKANFCDKNGETIFSKIRTKHKEFKCIGDTKAVSETLYLANKYEPTDKLFIVITEGEIDALTILQVMGVQYPVVSLPNGAQGAEKTIRANLEYLNGFKHIILGFDNDEAGRKAAESCIDIFEPGKVRLAHWTKKDANEMHLAGLDKEISSCIWNAEIIKAEGIISFDEITVDQIKEMGVVGETLPFPHLSDMIGGLRPSSITTIVAREKAGKSSFTRELALGMIEKNKKVGLLYLEESAIKEALTFVAMKMNMPVWQLEAKLQSPEMVNVVKHELDKFKDSGIYIYDHKGVIDVDSVYNKISYMVKGLGCDIIILDNLSITIAGLGASADERKSIDALMFKLVKFVNNTKISLINVVHAVKNRRDAEGNDVETITRADVHGSGAFAKFSHVMIGLEKDGNDTVKTKILANRFKGIEGYADTLHYNRETGRLV